MNLIMTVDEAWGVDRDEELSTHLPGNMRYSREIIRGKIAVMGRKTLESLLDTKPLKSRVDIMLTQNRNCRPEEVTVCHDINKTLEALKQYSEEGIFIIGKGVIYGGFLPYCKKAYATCTRGIFQADAKLVDLDQEKD